MYKNIWSKPLSVFLIMTFLVQTGLSGNAYSEILLTVPSTTQPELAGIIGEDMLPASLAALTPVVVANPKPLTHGQIYLLPDAHALYPMQTQTIKILEQLENATGQRPWILAESAIGELIPEQLDIFSEQETQDAFLDKLMSMGELSGWEKFVIEDYRQNPSEDKRAFGLESAGLYKKNLTQFRAVYSAEAFWQEGLQSLKSSIDRSASRNLSPEVWSFVKAWTAYQDDEDLEIYRKKLLELSRETLKMDLSEPRYQSSYPMLSRLIAVEELDRLIRLDNLGKEKEIKKFELFLQETGFTDPYADFLLPQDIGFKAKSLNLRETVQEFFIQAQDLGFVFSDYPSLTRLWGREILGSEIAALDFSKEIHSLEGKVLSEFKKDPLVANLLSLYEDWILLGHLLSLHLSRDEFAKVEKNLKNLRPVSLRTRISAIAESGSTTANDQSFRMEIAFQEALDFYRTAIARETVFAGKIKEFLPRTKGAPVVILAGGFHREGISEILKQMGADHMIIEPSLAGKVSAENLQKAKTDYKRSLLQTDLPREVAEIKISARDLSPNDSKIGRFSRISDSTDTGENLLYLDKLYGGILNRLELDSNEWQAVGRSPLAKKYRSVAQAASLGTETAGSKVIPEDFIGDVGALASYRSTFARNFPIPYQNLVALLEAHYGAEFTDSSDPEKQETTTYRYVKFHDDDPSHPQVFAHDANETLYINLKQVLTVLKSETNIHLGRWALLKDALQFGPASEKWQELEADFQKEVAELASLTERLTGRGGLNRNAFWQALIPVLTFVLVVLATVGVNRYQDDGLAGLKADIKDVLSQIEGGVQTQVPPKVQEVQKAQEGQEKKSDWIAGDWQRPEWNASVLEQIVLPQIAVGNQQTQAPVEIVATQSSVPDPDQLAQVRQAYIEKLSQLSDEFKKLSEGFFEEDKTRTLFRQLIEMGIVPRPDGRFIVATIPPKDVEGILWKTLREDLLGDGDTQFKAPGDSVRNNDLALGTSGLIKRLQGSAASLLPREKPLIAAVSRNNLPPAAWQRDPTLSSRSEGAVEGLKATVKEHAVAKVPKPTKPGKEATQTSVTPAREVANNVYLAKMQVVEGPGGQFRMVINEAQSTIDPQAAWEKTNITSENVGGLTFTVVVHRILTPDPRTGLDANDVLLAALKQLVNENRDLNLRLYMSASNPTVADWYFSGKRNDPKSRPTNQLNLFNSPENVLASLGIFLNKPVGATVFAPSPKGTIAFAGGIPREYLEKIKGMKIPNRVLVGPDVPGFGIQHPVAPPLTLEATDPTHNLSGWFRELTLMQPRYSANRLSGSTKVRPFIKGEFDYDALFPDGVKVRIMDLSGVKWCGPCKQSMPYLGEFATKFAKEKVPIAFSIVNVSQSGTGDDPNGILSDLANMYRIPLANVSVFEGPSLYGPVPRYLVLIEVGEKVYELGMMEHLPGVSWQGSGFVKNSAQSNRGFQNLLNFVDSLQGESEETIINEIRSKGPGLLQAHSLGQVVSRRWALAFLLGSAAAASTALPVVSLFASERKQEMDAIDLAQNEWHQFLVLVQFLSGMDEAKIGARSINAMKNYYQMPDETFKTLSTYRGQLTRAQFNEVLSQLRIPFFIGTDNRIASYQMPLSGDEFSESRIKPYTDPEVPPRWFIGNTANTALTIQEQFDAVYAPVARLLQASSFYALEQNKSLQASENAARVLLDNMMSSSQPVRVRQGKGREMDKIDAVFEYGERSAKLTRDQIDYEKLLQGLALINGSAQKYLISQRAKREIRQIEDHWADHYEGLYDLLKRVAVNPQVISPENMTQLNSIDPEFRTAFNGIAEYERTKNKASLLGAQRVFVNHGYLVGFDASKGTGAYERGGVHRILFDLKLDINRLAEILPQTYKPILDKIARTQLHGFILDTAKEPTSGTGGFTRQEGNWTEVSSRETTGFTFGYGWKALADVIDDVMRAENSQTKSAKSEEWVQIPEDSWHGYDQAKTEAIKAQLNHLYPDLAIQMFLQGRVAIPNGWERFQDKPGELLQKLDLVELNAGHYEMTARLVNLFIIRSQEIMMHELFGHAINSFFVKNLYRKGIDTISPDKMIWGENQAQLKSITSANYRATMIGLRQSLEGSQRSGDPLITSMFRDISIFAGKLWQEYKRQESSGSEAEQGIFNRYRDLVAKYKLTASHFEGLVNLPGDVGLMLIEDFQFNNQKLMEPFIPQNFLLRASTMIGPHDFALGRQNISAVNAKNAQSLGAMSNQDLELATLFYQYYQDRQAMDGDNLIEAFKQEYELSDEGSQILEPLYASLFVRMQWNQIKPFFQELLKAFVIVIPFDDFSKETSIDLVSAYLDEAKTHIVRNTRSEDEEAQGENIQLWVSQITDEDLKRMANVIEALRFQPQWVLPADFFLASEEADVQNQQALENLISSRDATKILASEAKTAVAETQQTMPAVTEEPSSPAAVVRSSVPDNTTKTEPVEPVGPDAQEIGDSSDELERVSRPSQYVAPDFSAGRKSVAPTIIYFGGVLAFVVTVFFTALAFQSGEKHEHPVGDPFVQVSVSDSGDQADGLTVSQNLSERQINNILEERFFTLTPDGLSSQEDLQKFLLDNPWWQWDPQAGILFLSQKYDGNNSALKLLAADILSKAGVSLNETSYANLVRVYRGVIAERMKTAFGNESLGTSELLAIEDALLALEVPLGYDQLAAILILAQLNPESYSGLLEPDADGVSGLQKIAYEWGNKGAKADLEVGTGEGEERSLFEIKVGDFKLSEFSAEANDLLLFFADSSSLKKDFEEGGSLRGAIERTKAQNSHLLIVLPEIPLEDDRVSMIQFLAQFGALSRIAIVSDNDPNALIREGVYSIGGDSGAVLLQYQKAKTEVSAGDWQLVTRQNGNDPIQFSALLPNIVPSLDEGELLDIAAEAWKLATDLFSPLLHQIEIAKGSGPLALDDFSNFAPHLSPEWRLINGRLSLTKEFTAHPDVVAFLTKAFAAEFPEGLALSDLTSGENAPVANFLLALLTFNPAPNLIGISDAVPSVTNIIRPQAPGYSPGGYGEAFPFDSKTLSVEIDGKGYKLLELSKTMPVLLTISSFNDDEQTAILVQQKNALAKLKAKYGREVLMLHGVLGQSKNELDEERLLNGKITLAVPPIGVSPELSTALGLGDPSTFIPPLTVILVDGKVLFKQSGPLISGNPLNAALEAVLDIKRQGASGGAITVSALALLPTTQAGPITRAPSLESPPVATYEAESSGLAAGLSVRQITPTTDTRAASQLTLQLTPRSDLPGRDNIPREAFIAEAKGGSVRVHSPQIDAGKTVFDFPDFQLLNENGNPVLVNGNPIGLADYLQGPTLVVVNAQMSRADAQALSEFSQKYPQIRVLRLVPVAEPQVNSWAKAQRQQFHQYGSFNHLTVGIPAGSANSILRRIFTDMENPEDHFGVGVSSANMSEVMIRGRYPFTAFMFGAEAVVQDQDSLSISVQYIPSWADFAASRAEVVRDAVRWADRPERTALRSPTTMFSLMEGKRPAEGENAGRKPIEPSTAASGSSALITDQFPTGEIDRLVPPPRDIPDKAESPTSGPVSEWPNISQVLIAQGLRAGDRTILLKGNKQSYVLNPDQLIKGTTFVFNLHESGLTAADRLATAAALNALERIAKQGVPAFYVFSENNLEVLESLWPQAKQDFTFFAKKGANSPKVLMSLDNHSEGEQHQDSLLTWLGGQGLLLPNDPNAMFSVTFNGPESDHSHRWTLQYIGAPKAIGNSLGQETVGMQILDYLLMELSTQATPFEALFAMMMVSVFVTRMILPLSISGLPGLASVWGRPSSSEEQVAAERKRHEAYRTTVQSVFFRLAFASQDALAVLAVTEDSFSVNVLEKRLLTNKQAIQIVLLRPESPLVSPLKALASSFGDRVLIIEKAETEWPDALNRILANKQLFRLARDLAGSRLTHSDLLRHTVIYAADHILDGLQRTQATLMPSNDWTPQDLALGGTEPNDVLLGQVHTLGNTLASILSREGDFFALKNEIREFLTKQDYRNWSRIQWEKAGAWMTDLETAFAGFKAIAQAA